MSMYWCKRRPESQENCPSVRERRVLINAKGSANVITRHGKFRQEARPDVRVCQPIIEAAGCGSVCRAFLIRCARIWRSIRGMSSIPPPPPLPPLLPLPKLFYFIPQGCCSGVSTLCVGCFHFPRGKLLPPPARSSKILFK